MYILAKFGILNSKPWVVFLAWGLGFASVFFFLGGGLPIVSLVVPFGGLTKFVIRTL